MSTRYFSTFVVLECLFQQISHLCRCLFLHLVRGMGVGGEGREGVSELMEADVFQSGILEDLLMELYHRIGVIHPAAYRRGKQIGIAGMLIVFLF